MTQRRKDFKTNKPESIMPLVRDASEFIFDTKKQRPIYSNKEIQNLPIQIIGKVVEMRRKF